MFLGEDTHALDEKGRVVMPSRFRSELADGCVVSAGREGQLNVFPVDVYLSEARELRSRPRSRLGDRQERFFFGLADQQTLDKSGRLLVKPELRSLAGLEVAGGVVVLGMFDHVELWDPAAYEREKELAREAYMERESDEEVATAS